MNKTEQEYSHGEIAFVASPHLTNESGKYVMTQRNFWMG